MEDARRGRSAPCQSALHGGRVGPGGLGAWGCEAFGNDPARTARDFHTALAGEFAGAFAEVVFAIADWSPERGFLAPFAEEFRA
ncbi:MAG: hypothetical protein KAX51_00680 [Chromatiaceae bacterium]|nr:hypothetical protein [Chromatiaceae bacterium]MBP6806965.1 hypothetical protein [Chromatiaceae bacterium]MBP8282626.1 hypothetical protein [Chromatiaceae bacterium]MBP8288338.1 hypothetical protein [Chromatiaceae bacterium]MBP9603074.1 hypothetical protein [Chromatiaceae bacterium]